MLKSSNVPTDYTIINTCILWCGFSENCKKLSSFAVLLYKTPHYGCLTRCNTCSVSSVTFPGMELLINLSPQLPYCPIVDTEQVLNKTMNLQLVGSLEASTRYNYRKQQLHAPKGMIHARRWIKPQYILVLALVRSLHETPIRGTAPRAFATLVLATVAHRIGLPSCSHLVSLQAATRAPPHRHPREQPYRAAQRP